MGKTGSFAHSRDSLLSMRKCAMLANSRMRNKYLTSYVTLHPESSTNLYVHEFGFSILEAYVNQTENLLQLYVGTLGTSTSLLQENAHVLQIKIIPTIITNP